MPHQLYVTLEVTFNLDDDDPRLLREIANRELSLREVEDLCLDMQQADAVVMDYDSSIDPSEL